MIEKKEDKDVSKDLSKKKYDIKEVKESTKDIVIEHVLILLHQRVTNVLLLLKRIIQMILLKYSMMKTQIHVP